MLCPHLTIFRFYLSDATFFLVVLLVWGSSVLFCSIKSTIFPCGSRCERKKTSNCCACNFANILIFPFDLWTHAYIIEDFNLRYWKKFSRTGIVYQPFLISSNFFSIIFQIRQIKSNEMRKNHHPCLSWLYHISFLGKVFQILFDLCD